MWVCFLDGSTSGGGVAWYHVGLPSLQRGFKSLPPHFLDGSLRYRKVFTYNTLITRHTMSMNFTEWANVHDKEVTEEGNYNDKVVRFDLLTVAIKDESNTGPTTVLVTDPEDPQSTDYAAQRIDVEFTEYGIEGTFVGNLRNKDGFTIEELNTFDS